MTDLRKKLIAIFTPNMALLIWALLIMIKSFDTGENWRIIFSIIGFVGLFTLTSLFAFTMIKKMKKEKIE